MNGVVLVADSDLRRRYVAPEGNPVHAAPIPFSGFRVEPAHVHAPPIDDIRRIALIELQEES
jgi:hypothetical protein